MSLTLISTDFAGQPDLMMHRGTDRTGRATIVKPPDRR
jgi:hypothetical protein